METKEVTEVTEETEEIIEIHGLKYQMTCKPLDIKTLDISNPLITFP